MPMDVASSPPWRSSQRRWLTLVAAAVIIASQFGPWVRVAPLLPPLHVPTRSPSSDVLMQALPLVGAADRLDALHASLPLTPGVVVVRGAPAAVASAYMVIAMRLWPRPVSLVGCTPAPHVEQFRVPHVMPAPTWRIDLTPGQPPGLWPAVATGARDAEQLCREQRTP